MEYDATLKANNSSLMQSIEKSNAAFKELERQYAVNKDLLSKNIAEKALINKRLIKTKEDLKNIAKDDKCIDEPVPDG